MPLWQSMQVFSPREQEALVRWAARGFCFVRSIDSRAVAVAAFERVVRLHPRPLALGQVLAQRQELVPRVDGAEDVAPDLLRGLHLARDLVASTRAARGSRGRSRARPSGW